MVRTNHFKVSMVLVAVMAAALVAMLLVAQKPAAGIPIDGGLCLSGPEICPPETSITSGPSHNGTVYTDSVTFGFSSNESGSTFECKLDNRAFERCTSPQPYTGLFDGPHTFQVRATDPQGKVDATPESRAWTVDTTQPPPDTPPETRLPFAEGGFSNGPPQGSTSHSDSASFKFYSNEPGSTFECKLDESNWEACTSPRAYTNLTNGSHTFQVRAIDPAGNVDSSPESRQWFVDRPPLTVPDTQINLASGATGNRHDGVYLTNSTIARFGFYSTTPWFYPPDTFECKLDDGAFESCTSGKEYNSLPDGRHTFEVRATNSAGTDDTPATWIWAVDTAAPTVGAVSPADAATGVPLTTNVTATFSDAMDPWSMDTQLGGQSVTLTEQGSSSPVAAAVSYSPTTKEATLDPGSDLAPNTTYTARVEGGSTRAKDLAGNALEQDYSWTFTTEQLPDTTAPSVDRVVPAENARGIAPGANVTAVFSEAMNADSINASTIQLYKKGSKTALDATLTYDATAKRAVLNPSANLRRGVTYKAVVSASVRDLADNALDQDPSLAGNQQKAWFFTVRT